jgi:ABC-type transport system substrate-binding protein
MLREVKMKKLLSTSYAVLALLLAAMLLLAACGEPEAAVPTAPAEVTPSAEPTPEVAPTVEKAVYGGTLRLIKQGGPRLLSWFPEFGPGEEGAILPAAEKMCEFTRSRDTLPQLCERYEISDGPYGKTITFHIKRGIKFTDGSDLNAEVVVWNYQIAYDSGRMQYDELVRGDFEILDDYTFRFHCTVWNPNMINSYGWIPIFSKAAFDAAAGGDLEKGKEWARQNIVTTGPFMLNEFKRDVSLSWVKNPNYWREGYPYLDAIEEVYIPDDVTAAAMMEAGEADMWHSPPIEYWSDFQAKGFKLHSEGGFAQIIFPNNKDPNSKWQNKKLREALEYALDKEAMAKALGYGYYEPLNGMAPKGEWGYIEKEVRKYDPEKARQCLADAGYPDGIKVTLLCNAQAGGRNTLGEAVKGYLDAAGIETTLDIADAGRFFTAIYLDGWDDLVLFFVGVDHPNYLNAFQRQLGAYPMSTHASWIAPTGLKKLTDESLEAQTKDEMIDITEKLCEYIENEALAIPIYYVPSGYLYAPYLHTTFLQEGMVVREFYREWMEPH